ncbi:translesion DNA synthesis-associated protein ImuA [Noviherbaspirillum galbum]|uniref:Translesion DNA synthesis-associated protein ImuA n=1 Tax=Noviherbaspirillum galbum TaxID=2709383 RepID=A0A6B3SY64_9BURK|nr:translesion DNA synthesis-associated protein ImuA [Noviherbaspirillum galbum]NEX62819.1 translesion DNA synthesis-associated protein ImuA [Noviherbaspirillum galbum]
MAALVSATEPDSRGELPPRHDVWLASQMASYRTPVIPTGHAALDEELPNGGWPCSVLIELLLQDHGIGEMRLLRPALTALGRQRRIALIQPPYMPQVAAWTAWGLPADRLLRIQAERAADALWSAEQVLRNGSCGALLFWQTQVRAESLRRLHLAAQASETVFWLLRPLVGAQDASPSPLRLALHPAIGGIDVRIVKRRGPHAEGTLRVDLLDMPFFHPFPPTSPVPRHAYLDRRAPAAAAARNDTASLV